MRKHRTVVGLDRLTPLLLLLAGLLLRLYFVQRQAFVAADSTLYQDIAQSWLHKGIYGFATATSARPTLIRLPGYPLILAGLAWLFDPTLKAAPGTLRSFLPVFWLQIAADLATCWIVSSMARRIGGPRAGLVALALACLCPFTANYTAVPLTETFTLFFLALAFYALQQWLSTQNDGRHSERSEESRRVLSTTAAQPFSTKGPHVGPKRKATWLLVLAFALAWSILLRPDQGLLAAAILPVLFVAADRKRVATVALCVALTALPFVPWTVRNYRTFHVIQPLAPKQAIDPGETAPLQFQRWFRTWGADFTATQDAYWNYPEDAVSVNDLPPRAFDSAEQRERTDAVLKRAADAGKLTPSVEDDLKTLADERIAAHPFRYYVALPIARLLNMLLNPRVEMLPVAERWWQYREHPLQTVLVWSYAALNLAYFIAAGMGFAAIKKRQRLLALSMAGYIALRCLLLLTLDNAEQRYTLEFFSILIVFASGLWMRRPKHDPADYMPVTL